MRVLVPLVLALATALAFGCGCGGSRRGPSGSCVESACGDAGPAADRTMPDMDAPAAEDAAELPSCPSTGCPAGTYCDLTSDRCVAGCIADDACAAGEICEERRCIAGCRDDSGCPPRTICEASVCTSGCRSCPDDGNDCTDERCVDGECTHARRADGAGCESDSNMCTLDVCMGGSCTHAADPSFPACDLVFSYPGTICVDRSCQEPDYYCMVHDGGAVYAPYTSPSGGGSLAASCSCVGTTLTWVWHTRVGGGMGSEACSTCRSYRYTASSEPHTIIGCWVP